MFLRSTRINFVVSLLFIVAMGACGNLGGCGACGSTQPLPGGKLPTDQTVEGGAQVRVTKAGFDKLKMILPGLLNQQLGSGFCVPKGQVGDCSSGLGHTGACYCTQDSGSGCNPGCRASVTINPNGLSISVPNQQTMNIALSTKLTTQIQLTGRLLGASLGSCTLSVSSPSLGANLDIGFGIKPADGELEIKLSKINSVSLNLDISGCGFLGDIADLVGDLLDSVINSFAGEFLLDLLTPAVNNLIQGFLPSPLGIAGMMDIGGLLEGVSPGTDGFMEARVVPGGYVNLVNNGLSLGVITGLNADEDPATRTADLDSEPHLCVPPIIPPSFSGAPWSLPSVARSGLGGSTFALAPAGAFGGTMDPAADLAMGVSETTLDLAGHHLVTSGGLCLGVGTSFIKQLNLGTIGILVPSLAELESDKGNDPLLLVTRPQKSVDFTIGENTTASPALTIHLNHIEVDFYAFIWERYIRAFTLDLTMNVGVNLGFEQVGNGPAVIKPELVGISSSDVTVKVLNSQFVRETPAHLEGVLPSVFDLITPLLGNLPDIQVPSFAGFTLNNLSIKHVTTTQDDFLALYASLGASQMMRTIAETEPLMADAVHNLDMASPREAPAPSQGRARLLQVLTPEPAKVRSGLLREKGGALPEITFEVDRFDNLGRELEWSWNLNGGFWRPYTSASPLVISDKAFAWQGKYEIGLKSRVKGDYRTVSEITRTPVVIDSVGPNIFGDKARFTDDDELKVPVWDVVYGKDCEVAFGHVGDDRPTTEWMPARTATLTRAQTQLLARDGEIAVFARDEQGNETIAFAAPFHGQAGESGCNCQTTGAPGAGSLILFGLVGLGLFGRRRGRTLRVVKMLAKSRALRSAAMFVGIVVVSSLVPGCSCGKQEAKACETAEDCGPDYCPEGQLPFCIDNTCVCSDDIPPGRIGPYSDVAVGGGAIWVSAYASSHGDLVVAQATGGRIPDEAWEWVDGVPEGPVIVPDSKIRNGIADAGADVGMYTSIAVTPDGTPMVSYFDRDTASLKFAAKVNGTWQISTVDIGTSQIDPGSGGTLAGMYTSLTLRGDDNRPGIAYLVHAADATGEHAEVRYASAQSPFPTGPGDWQFWTVDTAPVPEDPDEVYPLPGGLGLFVDSARNPTNQAPVVVYYDRTNGDLKLAKFNPMTGQFATPVILDGTNGIDAGWSPTVQVDDTGVAHVAYVGATGDDLTYVTDAPNAKKEIIDSGYRIVGQTVDGLPKPEFHFVGDDVNIVLPPGAAPMVAYQDATTQQLLLAQRQQDGTWMPMNIAGAEDPWPGAYGFFAAAAVTATDVVMSTWVINQPEDDNWVEVFTRPTVIQ